MAQTNITAFFFICIHFQLVVLIVNIIAQIVEIIIIIVTLIKQFTSINILLNICCLLIHNTFFALIIIFAFEIMLNKYCLINSITVHMKKTRNAMMIAFITI